MFLLTIRHTAVRCIHTHNAVRLNLTCVRLTAGAAGCVCIAGGVRRSGIDRTSAGGRESRKGRSIFKRYWRQERNVNGERIR